MKDVAMRGASNSNELLIVGDVGAISAFSPVVASFSFLERDFKGAAVPLFARSVVGSLETFVLLSGFVTKHALQFALLGLWIFVSSYCSASMFAFALAVARRQPYRASDVWRYMRARRGS